MDNMSILLHKRCPKCKKNTLKVMYTLSHEYRIVSCVSNKCKFKELVKHKEGI